MTDTVMINILEPLRHELGVWAAMGKRPVFWLRDDDAVADHHALRRLILLCAEHGVPPLLAVIPAVAEDSLLDAISADTLLLVHGLAHHNHEIPPNKKCELGMARPLDVVAGDVARGLALMKARFGDRVLPVLVPPWNRVRADLTGRLNGEGFTGISTFGTQRFADEDLVEVNTHLDIMDWRKRRGREAGDLTVKLVAHLAARRAGDPGAPLGILTHHAVHDEAAWKFLAALMIVCGQNVDWVRGDRLFPTAC